MSGIDRANRARERWVTAVRWGLPKPTAPYKNPTRFPVWFPDSEPWEDPDWDAAGRVHDWRNYVPDGMKDEWDDMSTDARIAVYVMADGQAMAEEWD